MSKRPQPPQPGDDSTTPGKNPGASRRQVLRFGSTFGAMMALGSLPVFTASEPTPRLAKVAFTANPTRLWYTTPGVESSIISQGLALGNGRIGALVTGDPAKDVFFLSDATMWTGGLNNTLLSNGQFPYDEAGFGSFQMLAKAYLTIPTHTMASITSYTRQLDLSNGFASATYVKDGVTYTREAYISHPDDVMVIRLTQSGGGSYTGSFALNGTHTGDTTTASGSTASFGGTFTNSLKYGAAVRIVGTGGSTGTSGGTLTFTGCTEVRIIVTGGTNYVPDSTKAFKDPTVDPKAVATTKVSNAAALSATSLFDNHLADHQALFNAMWVNLGTSTAAQKAKDTTARLLARGTSTAAASADPELEATYLQFGRYLTIAGSRSGLPTNLEGLWIDHNGADPWRGDYHTNINLQMNYWLPDRAGLPSCFDALTNYCLAQLPAWKAATATHFNDSRNTMYRNSAGGTAPGWTIATSANVFGGLGWEWNPAGNAWLSNQLFEHYEYVGDPAYLAKIYDLIKGACEFWQQRLISRTVTVDGAQVTRLVGDVDWSPEHGPHGQLGISYAQELVWQLFENYRKACLILARDATYAATIKSLQDQLYLPQINTAVTPHQLQEWMSPTTTGEATHRHLSPLVGLFPGDRINTDTTATAVVDAAEGLLTARGLQSYGWATAWRSLCWSRLKNADKAYQTVLNVIGTSSTARNLFDMYSPTTFQIDANYGTPAAMLEMLLYARPGVIELLPALPAAWATGSITGLGARGGFTVDMAWSGGAVTTATVRSVRGGATVVRSGSWSKVVVVPAGGSVTVTPTSASSTCFLTNRDSGKVIDVPGSSTATGTALIQYSRQGSNNQKWVFSRVDDVWFTIKNLHSNLTMDVSGGSTADGASIIQWSATSGTNQHWRLDDAGGGHVKIVSRRSGKVLGINAASNIVQQTDTGSTSQHWRLEL